MKKCNRCGNCCLTAHACDLRGWILQNWKQAKFEGVCDQLEIVDGIATCKVMLHAFDKNAGWYEPTREWILKEFIGRGCEMELHPELFTASSSTGRVPME